MSKIEILNDNEVPADVSGQIKRLEDKLTVLLEKAGADREEAKARSEALGARLVEPEKVPSAYKSRPDFDETRLHNAYLANMIDRDGSKGIRKMSPEELDRQTSEAIERGAFAKQVAKVADKRGVSEKTISDGSHNALVQIQFANDYIVNRYLLSQFREYAQVVPMAQASVQWPKLTSSTPTPVLHTRGTVEAPDDITVSNVTLTASQLMGGILLPNETIRDATPGLLAVVYNYCGTQMRKKAEQYYATGTGSSQPEGIASTVYSNAVAVSGNLTASHLIRALNELGDEWTSNPAADGLCWVGNQYVKSVCMQLKDGENRPLFMRIQTTPNAGPQYTPQGAQWEMLGIPFVVLPGLSGTANASGVSKLYLGAWKYAFAIGEREDLRVDAFDQTYATSNSTYIRTTMGHDSRILQSDAVIELQGIAG
jgi:HK97 family phage major capsid protein